MTHGTVMAMATAARSGLSKRQPSSKLSTSSSCCCCRVDSRGHSGEWQTHAAASTGRSCLDSSPRPDRRLPEPQLVVMPCNSRPPCGEPSIVVWHGGGTTPAVSSAPGGPKRTPAWPPRGPLQPLAACQTQGQTGSSPFRPQPRSVRARFGWRSRTPESPMAIPTQVPDRETGRGGGERGPLILCRRSLRTSPDFSLCFLGNDRRIPKKQRSRSHPSTPSSEPACHPKSPRRMGHTAIVHRPPSIVDLAAPLALAPGRDRSGSVRLRSSSHSAIHHPNMSASA